MPTKEFFTTAPEERFDLTLEVDPLLHEGYTSVSFDGFWWYSKNIVDDSGSFAAGPVPKKWTYNFDKITKEFLSSTKGTNFKEGTAEIVDCLYQLQDRPLMLKYKGFGTKDMLVFSVNLKSANTEIKHRVHAVLGWDTEIPKDFWNVPEKYVFDVKRKTFSEIISALE